MSQTVKKLKFNMKDKYNISPTMMWSESPEHWKRCSRPILTHSSPKKLESFYIQMLSLEKMRKLEYLKIKSKQRMKREQKVTLPTCCVLGCMSSTPGLLTIKTYLNCSEVNPLWSVKGSFHPV